MSSLAPMIDGILRADPLPADTARLLALANTSPRSPGLHLSSILKALDEMLHGKLHKENAYDLPLCATLGFTWERLLELAYKDLLGIRPQEITVDGIIMSPDGVGEDPYGEVPLVVEEYKCWWRSTKRTPMVGWYEVMQNVCYCNALGTNVGVFRVLYVVGDKWMDGPQYLQWRVEYDPDFIQRSWDMVIRNRGAGIVEV